MPGFFNSGARVAATLSLAKRRDVVVRALKTALLVGTILVVINHGDNLLQGEVSLVTALKMLLTFMVPYCVSTYASVSTLKDLGER